MRWEYQSIKLPAKPGFFGGVLEPAKLDECLNELGEQGWELVAAFDANQAGTSTTTPRVVVLTFKRPLA